MTVTGPVNIPQKIMIELWNDAWKSLEIAGRTGNGMKWPEMVRICWKWRDWLEMTGNGWNGWKWLEMAGNGWKLQGMAGNSWEWLQIAGNS